jgi:inner membrane protein
MDTLTHALSGALLARATAPRDAPRQDVRRRVAAGFLACAAPDLDVVFALFGQVEYLTNHRGITHSLLLLPLWALLLSWLLAKILREPRGWRALYGVSALAIGTHIAGDVITTFGTMVLAPWSDWRAAFGTTFIIDLWFTGIIVAGLAASFVWRNRRLPAAAATAVLLAYVGAQALLKGKAEEFGAQYAASLGLARAQVAVHPQPISPLNWMVFVSDDAAHRYTRVNLLREKPLPETSDLGFFARVAAVYRPLNSARWETRPRFGATPEEQALARDAWGSPALAFFRWFAAQPAFDGVTPGSTCVWFVDLRFATPGRDAMPFRYGACRDAGQAWRAYRRGSDDRAEPAD